MDRFTDESSGRGGRGSLPDVVLPGQWQKEDEPNGQDIPLSQSFENLKEIADAGPSGPGRGVLRCTIKF